MLKVPSQKENAATYEDLVLGYFQTPHAFHMKPSWPQLPTSGHLQRLHVQCHRFLQHEHALCPAYLGVAREYISSLGIAGD